MLGNTIAITVDGDPFTLTKINQDSYSSEYLYRDAVEEFTVKVRHQEVTKAGVTYDRHNFELRHKIFATSTVPEKDRLMYYVMEQQPHDLNIFLPLAAMNLATATSGAFLTSLTKWES